MAIIIVGEICNIFKACLTVLVFYYRNIFQFADVAFFVELSSHCFTLIAVFHGDLEGIIAYRVCSIDVDLLLLISEVLDYDFLSKVYHHGQQNIAHASLSCLDKEEIESLTEEISLLLRKRLGV